MAPRTPEPISYHAALVAQSLASGHAYGFDLMRATGLPSGTVYPLLRRLEAAGLVRSEWEDIDAEREGRPRRRYYALTAAGRKSLAAALPRLRAQWQIFGVVGDGDAGAPAR
ncbi:MAG: PadR family transcriptional regulator [Longimicrobiales bacterium]